MKRRLGQPGRAAGLPQHLYGFSFRRKGSAGELELPLRLRGRGSQTSSRRITLRPRFHPVSSQTGPPSGASPPTSAETSLSSPGISMR